MYIKETYRDLLIFTNEQTNQNENKERTITNTKGTNNNTITNRNATQTNENINTQQGRDIWNHHLEIESAKVGLKFHGNDKKKSIWKTIKLTFHN